MRDFTDQDKQALLRMARTLITAELIPETKVEFPANITSSMEALGGCFVTLHINGGLRGCIGTLEPRDSLIRCIENNAVNAAFRDPRFPPLKTRELDQVNIEISVLTPPEPLDHDGPDDLITKLKPHVHGLILRKGYRSSTFLPQVWEQLPEPEFFLTHLSQKAGLSPDAWKDPDTDFQVYEVMYFSE